MAIKDTGTEQLIKDTAKRIFFTEGKLRATTQEIADAAGINRTLLHYYFRSREVLLNQVFDEGMEATRKRLDKVFESDVPFKEKITTLIEAFLQEAIRYPYRELFVVTELNSKTRMVPPNEQQNMQKFLHQIEAEMEKGLLKKTDPRQFVMNLFALMAYPLVVSSLNKNVFNLDDAAYLQLMQERKTVILETIYP